MPTRPAILAIDQGTTNTKAFVICFDGTVLGCGSAQVPVEHPEPGWAEQSAAGIIDSVSDAIRQAVSEAGQVALEAVAISNQRESIAIWDADTGRPLGPCVIWQCRRSAPLCASLRQSGHESLVRSTTGLGLDPLFSSGKLRWLLDQAPQESSIKAGTVDAWLIWNLTGGAVHATDASNASRTQLMSLDSAQWDPAMLALFGIPIEVLPEIRSSDAEFGFTRGGFAGLPDGIPIRGVLGDSHAALYGHAITEPGHVKVTIGTGSSIMCPTGSRSRSTHGLSETVAWAAGGEIVYALEGNITVSGRTAAFACDILGLKTPEDLTRLARTVEDSDGVSLVPALAGLGAPHWNEDARGLICGMTLRTRPAHIARAALEAIAHQICDVVDAVEADLETPVRSISVDGAAAQNDFLVQLLADYSQKEVRRPDNCELSAIGAAAMAAQALGRASRSGAASDVVFRPRSDRRLIQHNRRQWGNAIRRSAFNI